MVNLTIDNKKISVPEGTTILDAASIAGIHIPTLCFMKQINEIGACRVCVVEVEGNSRLSASCNTVVEEGMVILTNSPKVRNARKTNVQLILSQHNTECTTCIRNGNCKLQTVSQELNILDNPFEIKYEKKKWDTTSPLIRDASKCIKCMRCVNICRKVQELEVWDIVGTGGSTTVKVIGGGTSTIDTAKCALCGQCVAHCPVGALSVRDDTDKLFDALNDPEKICVVQVAPSVRTAWGDDLGLSDEEATIPKMVAAIRALGVDYVFDTNFAADVTVMEEGSELVDFLTSERKNKFPMFTSCCPGWVRFVKQKHPELIPNLSTAKSPQQIFGTLTKTYFADKIGVDPGKIFSVSIMPCMSKKYESAVPELNDAREDLRDVDLVITTRELARMIRADYMDLESLPDSKFDSLLGESTGAGVIFGAAGGVMEAALRTAHTILTGKELDDDAFAYIRGRKGMREASVDIDGKTLHVAIVSGLGNAKRLIESIESGEKSYDFVEVMACPSGCVNGGGQPIRDGEELGSERARKLYALDEASQVRKSYKNSEVIDLYNDFLEKPLSETAHKLLHTDIASWKI